VRLKDGRYSDGCFPHAGVSKVSYSQFERPPQCHNRRMPTVGNAEAWKRMVLRSMPPPAWLDRDAPHADVVLSTRSRFLRNLRGHKFPHRADAEELQSVLKQVLQSVKDSRIDFSVHRHISNAEREYLVGCRLASPDFSWSQPGRALLLDQDRRLSVMVNEEDHLRVQGLTAGWSAETAQLTAKSGLAELGQRLEFAWSPTFGHLAASPYNAGKGHRLSAMFHLIGLAQSKRLPPVLKALAQQGIVARGLFGESSRAVGAFVQVSIVSGGLSEFTGAAEYLLREEREARSSLPRPMLIQRTMQVRDFAMASRNLSLPDALRVFAFARWAAYAGIEGFNFHAREIDAQLTHLEIQTTDDEVKAGRLRAEFVRAILEKGN
jgi:protein arginine kinase